MKTLILSLAAIVVLGAFAATAEAQYYDPAQNYYQPASYGSYVGFDQYQYQYSDPASYYPSSYYPQYQYEYTYPQHQYPQQYQSSTQYNYPTYDYPYYNQYYVRPVSVYCSANVNSAYPGQPVIWIAYATGGNGYFTYSWSGESVPNANSSSISTTYYAPGTKSPTVVVSSGNNRQARHNCSSVTVLGTGSYHQPRWWPW